MNLFPFFTDITNKTFIIIGAGKVAQGKINRLKNFNANIIVIDPQADIDGVKCICKAFEAEDLSLGDFVIAATDDKQLNSEISRLCMEKNIPVNSVDDPENCSFIFPSLIKHGDMVIGITSGGKSPALCKEIRRDIEELLPDNIEDIIDELYNLRQALKKNNSIQKERSQLLKSKAKELWQNSKD